MGQQITKTTEELFGSQATTKTTEELFGAPAKQASPATPPAPKMAWEGIIKPMLDKAKGEMTPDPSVRLGTKVRPKEKLPMPNVGEVVGGIQKNLTDFTNQAGLGGFNPSNFQYNPQTRGMERINAPYKSVMEGIGPGGVKEKGPGIGQVASEAVKGLADFVPDLIVDAATDPGRLLRERPLDVIFALEGFFGPKLRARATNLKARMKEGPISTEEINQIFAEMKAEAPSWKAPDEVKAAVAKAAPPAPTPAPPPEPNFSLANPEPTPTPFKPEAPYEPNLAAGESVAQAALPMADAGALFAEKQTPTLGKTFKSQAERRAAWRLFSGGNKRRVQAPSLERMQIGKDAAMERRNAGLPPLKKELPLGKRAEAELRAKALADEFDALEKAKAGARTGDLEATQAVADELLRGTQYDAETIGEFKKNVFMDGEEAKKIAQKYAKGEASYEQATTELRGLIKDTVEPSAPPTPGRKVPGLGMQMVDEKGRPMTMAQFLAKKNGTNIRAAEDLAVALTGAKAAPEQAPAPGTSPVAPTAPLTDVQQLAGAVAGAKKILPEQAALITKQRGERMRAFEQGSVGMSGEAKANARFAAQAGVMKHAEWEGIRPKFTAEAIDGFFDKIDRQPGWSEFDKMPATSGLKKILDGELPQPAEIDHMAVVFGKDLADALVARRDTMSLGTRLLYEAGNMPRALMASFDLSAPLRQGVFMVSHPKLFGKAFKEMPGYWGIKHGVEKFDTLQREIIQRPNYLLAKKSGLALTDVQRYLKGREEAFASTLAEKIPGVKGSERAYVGFLNKLRMDTFDYLVKMSNERNVKTPNMSPLKNPDVAKKIAALVNNATGRGNLKGAAERAALGLNSIFFSPRLMASRINLINPITYMKLPKYVRGWAVKTAVGDLMIAGTVLGAAKEVLGADVNFDYTSPDFLKIKVGNTRLDVMGGFSQYYRVLAQSANFLIKNYITGDKVDYNALDRLSRFLSYKEAPSFTFGAGLLRGKNIMGEKFELPKELVQRVVPMMAMDIVDVAKDDPDIANLLLAVPGVFGVGVQTYEEKSKKVKSY